MKTAGPTVRMLIAAAVKNAQAVIAVIQYPLVIFPERALVLLVKLATALSQAALTWLPTLKIRKEVISVMAPAVLVMEQEVAVMPIRVPTPEVFVLTPVGMAAAEIVSKQKVMPVTVMAPVVVIRKVPM
jgi:hypothetical protein